LKKARILRGRKLFSRVFQTGRRIQQGLITCRYAVLNPGDIRSSRVLIAFRATRRVTAVRRNRLKRLMREAMRLEYDAFETSLPPQVSGIGMILSINTSDDEAARRIPFTQVRQDLKAVLKLIELRLGGRQ
jgi:ribonuclease P protein component